MKMVSLGLVDVSKVQELSIAIANALGHEILNERFRFSYRFDTDQLEVQFVVPPATRAPRKAKPKK